MVIDESSFCRTVCAYADVSPWVIKCISEEKFHPIIRWPDNTDWKWKVLLFLNGRNPLSLDWLIILMKLIQCKCNITQNIADRQNPWKKMNTADKRTNSRFISAFLRLLFSLQQTAQCFKVIRIAFYSIQSLNFMLDSCHSSETQNRKLWIWKFWSWFHFIFWFSNQV